MNKIKHISQLYEEQLRLQRLEQDLEKTIRKDWKEVKYSMRPKSMAQEILSAYINKKLQDKIKSNGIISGGLSYGAAMLTQKLVAKVEEKIGDFFRK